MAPQDFQMLDTLLKPGALSATNRLVLDYWQSLRKDGALPNRADFNPARVRSVLSRLCLFEARAGQSLTCRLAGSAVRGGLGLELSGMDYTQYTPRAMQGTRIETYRKILDGLAMRNRRSAAMTSGRRLKWDELVLPFGDIREDGARQVLIMADFTELEYHEQTKDVSEVLGAPVSFEFFRI